MANTHMKSCSDIISHQRNAIKSTTSSHVTPTRMAISKRQITRGIDENVEESEPSYTAGGDGNINDAAVSGNLWKCLKKFNIQFTMWSSNSTGSFIPKRMKTSVHMKICM